MLKSLHIQNYALIEKLEMDFERGFSVITGETGAGKSIMLGAIALLLGQRADRSAIKRGAMHCVVEAHFDVSQYHLKRFFEHHNLDYDPADCIIRREVSSTGKSRAFINDTPVPLFYMKELGEMLIDIHSQHQNLLLNKEGFQLSVLDILSHDKDELEAYREKYRKFKELSHRLKEAEEASQKAKDDEEFLQFQWQQLDEAELKDDEQENLEQEAETLNHSGEIKQGLYAAINHLFADDNGVLSQVKDAERELDGLESFYSCKDLSDRLESCYIELKDIADELESRQEDVEFNPERLQYVNDRLNTLYTLEQKHHVDSEAELIRLRDDFRRKLDMISGGGEMLAELKEKRDATLSEVRKLAEVLTEKRKQAAAETERKMCDHLVPLGMPNIRFKVDVTPKKVLDEMGADNVNFLFNPNKNGALQNVAQIASGGEIARVMLSLKALIADAVKFPTIIFDEIDTGVSGNIAEKMAVIMKKMGDGGRQVISITHLPQIAAYGSVHYKVYKQDTDEGTVSHIVRLDERQRVDEIAHMLSGATLTEAAVSNAKELLKLSKRIH